MVLESRVRVAEFISTGVVKAESIMADESLNVLILSVYHMTVRLISRKILNIFNITTFISIKFINA